MSPIFVFICTFMSYQPFVKSYPHGKFASILCKFSPDFVKRWGHEIGVSCVRFIPSGGEGGRISRQAPGSSEGRACSQDTNPSSPPLFSSSCHSYRRRNMSRPPPNLQIALHPRPLHPPHLRACRRRLRACKHLHHQQEQQQQKKLNLYIMICTRTL